MATIGRLWAGQLYGTNTGKLFLKFSDTDVGALSGSLRLADDKFGVAVYRVSGTFADDKLTLLGDPERSPEGTNTGKVSAAGKLQLGGHFTGEWESEIGTAGTFELYPHLGNDPATAADLGPEQLYTAVRDLGSIRLVRADIRAILASIRGKFPDSRIVVTHIDRGAQIARFSDDFERSLEGLDSLRSLKVGAQTPVGGGLSKSVTIDLGDAFNRVTTQGPDEAWVLGEVEATTSFLRRKERRLATAIGRHQINFNMLILVGALIALPELPLFRRMIFAATTLIIVFAAKRMQESLIPNFVADCGIEGSERSAQIWPATVSWIISIAASVIASIIYGVLQGWFDK